MPLYDHFRPPISKEHDWVSFHHRWAVAMMDALNQRIPKRFLAETQIHLGRKAEADVIEFDRETPSGEAENNGHGFTSSGGGVALAAEPAIYSPPQVTDSFEIEFDDAYEVKVYDLKRSRRVVAVIELISPSNQDRPEERETFALKVLGYLKAGIGVVMVDIVTDMQFNLHNEVIRVGRSDSRHEMGDAPTTYAVAYRPVHRADQNFVDTWSRELTLGSSLPTLPLALKGFGCVPLDLEATYAETCMNSRIPE